MSLCNKALALEPNLADGYWIRGRHFRNTGQTKKAIVDLERAIEKMVELPGDFRIRISSMEPDGFGPEFYKILKDNNIFFEAACTLVLLSTNQY
mgnify:CR=1 FL=1